MSKRPRHNAFVQKDTPIYKMYAPEYQRYKADMERTSAINALAEMKKLEAKLRDEGKLVQVKLPHANGVVCTNTPEEFQRKIIENDFFRV